MWNYSEKVMDHFMNPRNVGEIENPDGTGEVGNAACGDALKLTFKLDGNGKIADVKFKTFGCASAIASSSMLTELVKGKTLEEAQKITNRDIAEALGGLPEEKMHCSVMGMEALQAAIADYRGETAPAGKSDDDEGRIVCRCFGVTDRKILKVAKENRLHDASEVTHYCKAGGACGSCLGEIQKLLDDMWRLEKAKNDAR
ncbi:MAG: Fe-S cluster assembly protein NifU [Victivallaceae bacterium]|nr:Fe-S cluster assembly protein NifU [Victivallaceae bacterium]